MNRASRVFELPPSEIEDQDDDPERFVRMCFDEVGRPLPDPGELLDFAPSSVDELALENDQCRRLAAKTISSMEFARKRSVRVLSDSFRKEIMPSAIKTGRTLLLQTIFGKYRGRILVTYIVTLSENLFELFYPSLTGLAVNGLLKHDFAGLGLLLGVWFAHTVTGVFRQRYDTRVFSSIYTDLATRTVSEQENMGVSTSQIVARSSLSREFVNFFERDIPATVNSVFGLLGALVLLLFYDAWSAVFCLMLLIPLAFLNRRYSRRTLTLNKRLNNQLEREVTVLTRRMPSRVFGHYRLLAKWRIGLSDAEAMNWGVMELFSIVLSAAVIIRIASLPDIKPGTIYAMLAYLWNFISSLNNVPTLVQQLSRLKDIARRMEQGLSPKETAGE